MGQIGFDQISTLHNTTNFLKREYEIRVLYYTVGNFLKNCSLIMPYYIMSYYTEQAGAELSQDQDS